MKPGQIRVDKLTVTKTETPQMETHIQVFIHLEQTVKHALESVVPCGHPVCGLVQVFDDVGRKRRRDQLQVLRQFINGCVPALLQTDKERQPFDRLRNAPG